jgi:hypothetical protein
MEGATSPLGKVPTGFFAQCFSRKARPRRVFRVKTTLKFVREPRPQGGARMPNHLTPDELSKELGIERQEVIRVCVEEGVPIYQGKIDKTLFQAQLVAIGALQPK